MPPMPHSIMLRLMIGATAAPLMPSFSSIRLWIVGNQITVVQIASNVPSAKSRPTSVLKRSSLLNSCSGTKRRNSRSSAVVVRAWAASARCRSRTAWKTLGHDHAAADQHQQQGRGNAGSSRFNRGGGFRHDRHPAVPSAKNGRLREVHMADYYWTGGDLPTFVTHLECSLTGERYPADTVQTLSTAGRPLLVRYDLDGVRRALPREALASRPQTLWRYRELLPVRRPENVVSLGEVVTPLIPLARIAARLAKGEILVKDEGRLPTGSFKARGLTLAVSMAKELGIRRMAMQTNGNAGAAMAAYCSRAGIKSYVFCPDDT